MTEKKFNVSSETDVLRKVLIHSPDSGLGKVVPSKAQDWLFEDIVHLDTIRKDEYDYYIKLLLYFLDPDKIKGRLKDIDNPENNRSFFKPDHADFHRSEQVIELQVLLSDLLKDDDLKKQLIASVCALESCSFATQTKLFNYSHTELAKIFLSGSVDAQNMIFPPIPNFIFTRDIGIVINDYILLNKPAKQARRREALLARYLFHYHPVFSAFKDHIIELDNPAHHFLMFDAQHTDQVTLEGGDVMMVSPKHLLIGISERTSWEAAHQVINILFDKKVVEKISVIQIPRKRDFMHIDTVFTQVSKDTWVMLGNFSKANKERLKKVKYAEAFAKDIKDEYQTEIRQFHISDAGYSKVFDSLEELLVDISTADLGCQPDSVRILYSGNGVFPYDVREQWTDSCNLLALKDGVVIGYDRNDKTIEAFRDSGFSIISVKELLLSFESGQLCPEQLTNILILMPSSELSRARGGFHCMSMPLLRN